MNDIATLLNTFGFTVKDAIRIARRAREKDMTLAHVQAWIAEAERSTSLHNPLGFVRARVEAGNKLPPQPKADSHITNRDRYKSWSPTREKE